MCETMSATKQLNEVKLSKKILADEVQNSVAEIFKNPNNIKPPDDLLRKVFIAVEDSNVPKTGADNKLSDNGLNIQVDSVMNKPPNVESKRVENKPSNNVRALSKHATTYELEKFEKKLLVIFNQVNVLGHKRRVGTEQDVEALTHTFENFGFTVITVTDATRNEIFDHLNKFADKDFTDYGCLAVAILTYGAEGGGLRASDETCFTEKDVINRVINNNPTLITKPKIVIFQASRGESHLAGIREEEYSNTVYEDSIEGKHMYTLPVESDLLIMHSSFPGRNSHRTMNGSWFIQALCRKINMLADTEDLESIIIAVKRSVALMETPKYNRLIGKMDKSKQMPIITSTLIRKLYLRNYQGKEVTTSAKEHISNLTLESDDMCQRELQQLRQLLRQRYDESQKSKESGKL